MSPQLRVDMTEAESFAPVDAPGVFPMKVYSVSEAKQGPKATYVEVQFAFLEPELDKKHGKVYNNYPINGKGAFRFKEMWKKILGEDLPEDAPIDVDTDELLGQEIDVDITIDYEYDPENPKNKVAKLISSHT
ncbi:MAG: hypothetical protein GTO63_30100 [Anaerolineae bacterium]|nr:hypothetical protein [Anaerolineae bacterium]NIN98958.1 hypothetical protein [Anaerolineae bacterium]